jgi:hypothetical protein
MGKKQRPKESAHRRVVRKGDQLVATLLSEADRKDFEQRLRAKCKEVGLTVPPLISYGTGEQVALVCRSRDQAIFLQDFAEEAIAEMPD